MLRSHKVIGAVLLALALPARAADEWKLDREGDGVKVFTRSDAGYSLKSFKAQTRVKAPLASVVALLADTDSFTQWYTDCSENRILKKISNKEFITYFVNDSPFPVMDRDSIMHTVISQDPTTKAVTFALTGQPKFIPEKDDYVRIPKLAGAWIMTPVSETETDVVILMSSDAGGSVPAFLANQQVTVAPYKTLVKMKPMLEKPKYKNASVDFESATVTYGK